MTRKNIDYQKLPKLDDVDSSLGKAKLADLQALGVALDIQNLEAFKKEELLTAVKAALAKTTEERFERFVAHRSTKSKGAATRTSARTSVSKAEEDDAAEKNALEATGAAKKLLEQGRTSDPPARTKKLTSMSTKVVDKAASGSPKTALEGNKDAPGDDNSSVSDLTEVPEESSPPPVTPDVDDEDTVEVEDNEEEATIKFSDATIVGKVTKPDQTISLCWIAPEHRAAFNVIRNPQTGKFSTAGLTRLITLALISFSPEKGFNDLKVRIPNSPGSIATVGQALKAEYAAHMELPQANRCELIYDKELDALAYAFSLEKPAVLSSSGCSSSGSESYTRRRDRLFTEFQFERFIELGPSTTLTGMATRTLKANSNA
ncbi:Fatty acid synthase [Mycena chlorophos]|uniref:Fatty acid synthase n=1 Tax=Mycena chlorophos TaxID=658473 RepID=A0A8H6T9Y0_MYCCL|nr:Fatty acid synthase [Mycena chlorophos]